MVKSSEVLHLAAEYEFCQKFDAVVIAARGNKSSPEDMRRQRKYLRLVNWIATVPRTEHAVTALCLAADIAESEGD